MTSEMMKEVYRNLRESALQQKRNPPNIVRLPEAPPRTLTALGEATQSSYPNYLYKQYRYTPWVPNAVRR